VNTIFDYHRGETIVVAIDAVTGDAASVTAITAKLKSLKFGQSEIDPNAAPIAEFAVTARAAAGDIPAGWNLTLSAAISATLVPGRYAADALITVGGGVIIPDYITIRIRETASR
jgi:hypothetical protein